MMKKKVLGILLLTLAILIPNYVVKADTPFELNCNDKAVDGEIIECKLKYAASSTDTVTAIKVSVLNNNSFTFDHVEFHEYYDNTSSNKETLSLEATSTTGIPTSDALVMLYFKANIKDSSKTSEQIRLLINTINGTMGQKSNINVTSNDIKMESKGENTLSLLEISNGTLTPKFDSKTTSYSVVVESEDITIAATPTDEKATVTINGSNNDMFSLKYGENTFDIKVTAQDKSEKIYKLTVTRKDERNDNSKLQLLSVDGKKITLKDKTYTYEVDVPYETEEANLLYAAASSTSKVEVTGSEKLSVGKNEIVITVTSEKGTVQKYYLTINRLKEVKSDDSSIKKLEITNVDVDFNFNSNNHNYMIKLPKNINKLNFNIELGNEKAIYNITGNENLENYSKVLIKVTAEDESSTTYSFLIEKKESNNLMIILIILILVLLALMIAIVFVVKKKKNNKKNKNDNNSNNNGLVSSPENEEVKNDNVIVFTDPGDSMIKDEKSVIEPEEKKEDNVIVFTDPEEKLVDTKEFVITKPAGIENQESKETNTDNK